MATRKRTPGSGSVFKDGKGVWRFRKDLGKDPATGKRRILEARGRTKAEARARFEAKLAALERTGLLPGGMSPYLADYAERWLADYRTRVKPTTYRTRAGRLKACCEVIGHVRLTDLTPEHIRHCMRVLGERLAPSTLKDHYVSLKMVLDDAELEELIPIDPCRKVRPPRVEPMPVRMLSPDQPARMIAAVPAMPESRRGQVDMGDNAEMWALLFELAFEAGMRAGGAVRAHAVRARTARRGARRVRAAADPAVRPARPGRDPQMARRRAPVRRPVADHAEDEGGHAVRAHPDGVVGPSVGAHPPSRHRPARSRVHEPARPSHPRGYVAEDIEKIPLSTRVISFIPQHAVGGMYHRCDDTSNKRCGT